MASTASASSRYDVLFKLAAGGMATVYVGQVRGALGFRQLVAIKRPHPHLLDDETFRTELVAEARLASMISHANVVDVRDVEITGEGISLVMDYVEGASLGELLVAASKKGKRLAPRAAVRILLDACAGLHAAHELVDERGRPVALVHRDVSPQNILVGVDGIARVADFGVAKFARKNLPQTSGSTLKGKLAYMPPEYVRGEAIDRRFDVFAAGIVLWEALTGRRCFRGPTEVDTLKRIVEHDPEPPSSIVPGLGTALDDVVATALAKRPEERFQNAAAMAAALERSALEAGLLGGATDVANAVRELVGAEIEERRARVRSKLAHEPSVASLMGVASPAPAPEAPDAPEPPPPSEATRTVVDAPPITAAPEAVRAAPASPALGPGGTLPLGSAPPPAVIAAAPPEPTVAPYTLMSAPDEPPEPSRAPRRGWAVPLLAFAGVLALTVVGGAYVLRGRDEPEPEPRAPASTPAPEAVVSAPPAETPTPPAPTVSAPATATASAPATSTSAVVTTHAPTPKRQPATKAPRPESSPATATPAPTAPAPTATPTASTRRPPANPYE